MATHPLLINHLLLHIHTCMCLHINNYNCIIIILSRISLPILHPFFTYTCMYVFIY